MSRFFVTGTDTGIGKTVVSASLTCGLVAKYWKPIQSGLDEETDSQFVSRFVSSDQILPERYRLTQALSPHHSAAIDGIEIDLEDFSLDHLKDYSGPLIVEGAGGVLVPINDKFMMADVIKKLDLPCIVVARSELGTLNHTFLTLNELRRRQIKIQGLVINGPPRPLNRSTLEERAQAPLLMEIPYVDKIDKNFLRDQFLQFEKAMSK